MHKVLHQIQQYLLSHPNPLNQATLRVLGFIDILWYSVTGATSWSRGRARAVGSPFCGLGRWVFTEYDRVENEINGSQSKGETLGRLNLIRGRLSPGFPLFLSSGEEHARSRDLIERTLISGWQERAGQAQAMATIANIVKTGDVQAGVIQWILIVLGGNISEITPDVLRIGKTQCFGPGFLPGLFALRRIQPIGYFVPGFRGRDEVALRDLIRPDLDLKDEDRWMLLETVVIAAALGLEHLAKTIMAFDLERLTKSDSLVNVVQELIRLAPPVNNVTVIQEECRQIKRGDRFHTVHPGTRISANVGATGFDDSKYPNPQTFDPSRPNICETLNFGAGPRRCPGESLALFFGITLLKERIKDSRDRI